MIIQEYKGISLFISLYTVIIIEILSKDENRDRKLKKGIYEKVGVKEYFIVDPKTKMVEAYILKDKKYVPVYAKKKQFQSALLKLEFAF